MSFADLATLCCCATAYVLLISSSFTHYECVIPSLYLRYIRIICFRIYIVGRWGMWILLRVVGYTNFCICVCVRVCACASVRRLCFPLSENLYRVLIWLHIYTPLLPVDRFRRMNAQTRAHTHIHTQRETDTCAHARIPNKCDGNPVVFDKVTFFTP